MTKRHAPSGACAAAACAAGACVGTSNACDDGNPCTVDACEPKTGACSHVATAGGAACSQNGMCGTCTAGLCTQNWLSGSDEFNGTALGSQWSIVNPDAAYWSLSAVPGSLQILFENGDIWKTANNASNVFLQPAPTGAFEITAKVAAKPSVSNNHASILLWQDMDNNVQLTRQFSAGNGGAIVNLTMEQGAAASNAFIVAIADVPVIWLRLAVSAGTATGYYSVDGATWILAGVVSAPTKLGQIGLFCHGVQESAAFDWFHVSAACTP